MIKQFLSKVKDGAKALWSTIVDHHKSFCAEVHSNYLHACARKEGCTDHTPCPIEAIPIVLVHGHEGHMTNFNTLRSFLEKAEIGPIHVIQFENPRDNIETHADELSRKINGILHNLPERKIRLIGVSRGGIVSAYYNEYLSEEQEVDVTAIVTLASPLSGTKIADLFAATKFTDLQLTYRCKFVNKLREKILANDTTPYYHIATRTDYVIVPHQSALTGKHKERELLVSGHSHNSILYCSKIADQIISWLRY
jgi:triacylglycerol esterase/lipase EstA (alpha/beta hydrolase family)